MSGGTLRQATCVAVRGRALLIEGPPGSGKSGLALALIDRGAMLVGDDGVRLAREGDAIVAHPPPNTAGLLELRNVGLVEFPVCSAPLALILRLREDAPRYVEAAGTEALAGLEIPALTFHPGGPAPAVRAEIALERHGLR